MRDLIVKQGRILCVLAALLGAALFLFVDGCNNVDEEKTVEQAVQQAAQAAAGGGIGPDSSSQDGLLYEETPLASFNDYISQIDYSLAQAVQRVGLPISAMYAEQLPLAEHGAYLYHPQSLGIYSVADLPAMLQTIRDSLMAWAERASLVRSDAGVWQIMLEGAATHYLYFFEKQRPQIKQRPRLAIVIDDLGESKKHAKRLLALDYPVTFAIWPHSSQASAVAKMAHEAGLYVIVHQPMEPVGYPQVNPGKGVLLSGMSREEILAVLEQSLSLVPHAIGLNNHMGSRLTQDEDTMRIVSHYLASRHMLMLDSVTHAGSRFAKAASATGAPAFKRDIFLDVEADKDKVLAQLKKAEQVALLKGQAIAIGHPLAATLDALEAWQGLRNPNVDIVHIKSIRPIAPTIKYSGNNVKN